MVQYNRIPANLPEHRGYKIYLVVVKGFWLKRMIFLRSCSVACHRKESVGKMVEHYQVRWRSAESYPYIKQCYHLEDRQV